MALLQQANTVIQKALPSLDLANRSVPQSFASLLAGASAMLFYGWKIEWLHGVLNSTATSSDAAGPELLLNPLETVGQAQAPELLKVLSQLDAVDPALMRVKVASGGDPKFPLTIRMAGEFVQGNSGSFREFLSRVVRDVLAPSLALFVECPSAALGRNTGRHVINPDSSSPLALKTFEFLGLLMGQAMRADVPLVLDLLPCVWKALVGLPLTDDDLTVADYALAQTIAAIAAASTQDELDEALSDAAHMRTLGNRDWPAVAQPVSLDRRDSFVELLRTQRLTELAAASQIAAIRRGLGLLVPLHTLSILSWQDFELRVCGQPDIDLAFLRQHTVCNVGLAESDPHIRFFWNTLESFSKDDLRRFLKFACNQERLPGTCVCQGGAKAHTPPYPMKLAPPDGSGPPDKRFIRAETCLFMIKLPQYSTQALMTERLLYAIHCREDPLSG